MKDDFLSYRQVADAAGTCEKTIRNWIKSGRWPKSDYMLGTKHFWSRKTVQKALAGAMRPVKAGSK